MCQTGFVGKDLEGNALSKATSSCNELNYIDTQETTSMNMPPLQMARI